MADAGIDIGSQSTKVVILEGDRILAAVTLKTGESGDVEARLAMEEALRRSNLKLHDLQRVVATGVGRMNAPFAQQQRSTMGCLAAAAHFLYPKARTIVDAGAESSTAIRLADDGTVADMTGNDKCAGGSGTFLDNADSGQLDGIHLLGWGADYPDPENFLDVLFHSRSSLNHSGWSLK